MERNAVNAQASGQVEQESVVVHVQLRPRRGATRKCLAARRCRLAPYDAPKDGVNGCCPSQTADHIVPKASFYVDGYKDGKGQKLDDWPDYKPSKAPCMCAEGGSNTAGSHGLPSTGRKEIQLEVPRSVLSRDVTLVVALAVSMKGRNEKM